ncbi:hypothetical protein HX017_17105 [Myroides marinus]|nr:hypothetical protein [Myroides marinus]MDM1352320.1 hypothetical protein [Myroides marinus]MDM1359526.1 hypothetical protein [Myroides marinus]MDM1366653.1 hypothetical protein [Myroides marinus]MDM1533757.1 hypothetical protein [Myroides marinus]MDM1540737.1 hypothetical protein [Myroides marinus]
MIILFVGINITQNLLDASKEMRNDYLQNIIFYLSISFPIKAFGEEILYRGLILPYLETKTID